VGRISTATDDTVVRQPAVVGNQPTTSQDHAQEILQNELVNLAAKVFDSSRPVDEYQSVTGATQLEVLPEYEMDELIESITIVANPTQAGPANPVPTTPNSGSVLASGVAQQNTNTYPVSVVIGANGATITNVSVNGITVGTAAGTYTVPAFGAISVTYTVATPTWVWSNASGTPATIPNVVTLQLGRRLWNFSVSGSGLIHLDGIGLRLNRNERRIVTQPVSGPLSLELTGHADMSGT
jgi:hypothetical protein